MRPLDRIKAALEWLGHLLAIKELLGWKIVTSLFGALAAWWRVGQSIELSAVGTTIVVAVGTVLALGVFELIRWSVTRRKKVKALLASDTSNLAQGQGGWGGNASVGTGIAIGGTGGRAGKYGRGGDGGSGFVAGEGLAVGGEGGAAGDDKVWAPPARSGYEIAMEQIRQPADPRLRRFGRGGMSAGYLERFQVVERMRAEYFAAHALPAQNVFENIRAVPLEYLNGKLESLNENWRVRIVQGANGQYEFFVPDGH